MSTLMEALLNGTELPADTAAALAPHAPQLKHYTEQARQAEAVQPIGDALSAEVRIDAPYIASVDIGVTVHGTRDNFPFDRAVISIRTGLAHVQTYATAAQARELGAALLRAAEMLEATC